MSPGTRHVIVGSSAAGLSAAEAVRRADPDADIMMVSEDTWPYSRTLLAPYYLGGYISRSALRTRDRDFFSENRIHTFFGQRAEELDPRRQEIALSGGRRLAYDRLLVATGALPALPDVPGSHLAGIHGLRSLREARRIREELGAARRIVVLGGGLLSLELCLVFRDMDIEQITVLESESHLLPDKLDPEAAGMIERDVESIGPIHVMKGQRIQAALGTERVESVRLTNGQTLGCDLLMVATGVQPCDELVRAHLEPGHAGVRVDQRMRTRLPNVFAAGDVCESMDLTRDRTASNRNLFNAVVQGKIAGLNMAGIKRTYEGSLNVSMFRSMTTTGFSVGRVIADRPGDVQEIRQDRRRGVYRKLLLCRGRLVGAVGIGDDRFAGTLLSLIRKRATISELPKSFIDQPRFGRLIAATRRMQQGFAQPGTATRPLAVHPG